MLVREYVLHRFRDTINSSVARIPKTEQEFDLDCIVVIRLHAPALDDFY